MGIYATVFMARMIDDPLFDIQCNNEVYDRPSEISPYYYKRHVLGRLEVCGMKTRF